MCKTTMVLRRIILYFLLFFIFFLFVSFPSFAREAKKEKNIEDIIITSLQDELKVEIFYRKKSGSIFSGFTFYDVSIYKGKREILKIKKLVWKPNIKKVLNPLALLKSFSIQCVNPVFVYYPDKGGTGYYSNLSIGTFKDFFKKIESYDIEINIVNGYVKGLYKFPIYLNGKIRWKNLLSFDDFILRIKEENSDLYISGYFDPLLKNESASLTVKASHIPSFIPSYFQGAMSFSLSLSSLNNNLKVQGRVDLEKGCIYIKEGSDLDKFFLNPYLDLIVKADKNIEIKGGNSYDFIGKGLFRIGSSLKIPKITGKFFIDTGKILFGNRYFKVTSGTIEFTDFTYLNPLIDISAQGNIDGVKIFAQISGFARSPKVRLTSIPYFSQDELSSLIILGTKIEDYQRENLNEFLTGESLNIAFRSLSLKFMNSLNEIGRKYFGLDTLSLEPSFEVYKEDIIKTRLTLKVGKYIGRDFYIRYERVLTPYANDIFGFELYPGKGFYFDFSIDRKSNIQIELIYEYTF